MQASRARHNASMRAPPRPPSRPPPPRLHSSLSATRSHPAGQGEASPAPPDGYNAAPRSPSPAPTRVPLQQARPCGHTDTGQAPALRAPPYPPTRPPAAALVTGGCGAGGLAREEALPCRGTGCARNAAPMFGNAAGDERIQLGRPAWPACG